MCFGREGEFRMKGQKVVSFILFILTVVWLFPATFVNASDRLPSGLNASSTYDVISLTKLTYSKAGSRCIMDMYIPKNKSGECGLILYIHGGAWTSNSKSDYTQTAHDDCSKYGVATIAINYRYASESVDAFDILDDISASLSKAKEVASQYGLRLTKVMLTGISAGAHLSMLYAYSRADSAPIKPVCVFEYAGPTDLTNPKLLETSFGPEEMMKCLSYLSNTKITNKATQRANAKALLKVSTVSYVTKNSAPTVVCHGTRDTVVDYSEAENIVAALKKAGATYELITFNSNHATWKDTSSSAYAQTRFDYYVNTYLQPDNSQPSGGSSSTFSSLLKWIAGWAKNPLTILLGYGIVLPIALVTSPIWIWFS